MSDQFPKMLFKAGGSEELHGGNFHTFIAQDEQDEAAALADGWHLTTPEAVAAVSKSAAPEVDDEAPPTRAELEAKATELGIKFDGRTTDAKLGEKIAAALG